MNFSLIILFVLSCGVCFGAQADKQKSREMVNNQDNLIPAPEYLVTDGGAQFRHGDPGWTRKMARRKLLRQKASTDKTALAGLQTDYLYLPVLLVNFPDEKGKHSVEEIRDFYFENNPNGTITDYFTEVSYGQFMLTGDVYGWYQLDNPEEYYNANEFDANSFPQNSDGFVIDAVSKADPYIDFSKYDNDGPDGIPDSGDDDGYVDAVMITFPGVLESNSLIGSMGLLVDHPYATEDLSFSGSAIQIYTYIKGPEFTLDSGLSFGVACHEIGHVLGLPDLYDEDGSSFGLGLWCLMSGGAYLPSGNPGHLSAWCKIQLGWVTPLEVGENSTVYIDPVESGPAIYKIWEDGFRLSRYFLLENRQNTGFDYRVPGIGVLIYHVDENRQCGRWGSVNNDEDHKLVDLEEADGKRDLDLGRNPGDGTDPFPGSIASTNNTFDDLSNPNSRDYDGNSSGVVVRNIGYTNRPTMQAEITVSTPVGYSIMYDPNGLTGHGWSDDNAWGGVLFKADEPGILAALDIGFAYDTDEYEIKIYSTIVDSLPTGLIHTVSGESVSEGWHTISLDDQEIITEKDQEFFVVYRTSDWIWVDIYSEYTGRSYYSDNGIYFTPMLDQEYGNFNIRARIRTVLPEDDVVYCDFNRDGAINVSDVIALLLFTRDNPGDLKADFNGDGDVNVLDAIAMLLAQLNGTCPD
ncbi:M6 family metalloprotease domain-containing protein [Gemmatimonadota bacterium]